MKINNTIKLSNVYDQFTNFIRFTFILLGRSFLFIETNNKQ